MTTVVLSYSPPRSPLAVTPPRAAAAAMSSSPGLPSPSLLFSRMGSNLVGGSRATPVPADAMTGFASASTSLRRASSVDEARAASPSKTGRKDASRVNILQTSGKVQTQSKGLGNGEENVPVFKMPSMLQKEALETVSETIPPTASVRLIGDVKSADILAPQKSRRKKNKDEGEAQTTIKKTKITKPGAMKSSKKASGSTKKAEKGVPESLKPASTQEEDVKAREEFRELCLEKAITRKKDWTPCKDTAPDPNLNVSEELEKSMDSKLPVINAISNEPLNARFGSLIGDFSFLEKGQDSPFVSEASRQGNGEAAMKKRKIELVNGVAAPRVSVSEKPKRSKSPKKKPQTVTEKATAPFATTNSIAATSLLQFFETPAVKPIVPARDVKGKSDSSVAARGRSSAKKSAKSCLKNSKAKKSTPKQLIILSPEAAVENAKNQALIFGTSSQLACEDSPTFIKDLQQAMKDSELTVEQKQPAAKDYDFLDLPSGRSRSSNVRAIAASKSLWSAASRDIDGSLVEVEIMNLADTPKPLPSPRECIIVPKMPDSVESLLKAEESTPFDAGERVLPALKLDIDETADLQQPPQEVNRLMPRSVAEAALKTRPKSKSPVKKTPVAKPEAEQMPDYKSFTDIQLRKEIALKGFKSIKRRDTKILLLERCWKSQKAMALQEMPTNVSVPQPVIESTKTETSKQVSSSKRKGRPPKGSEQEAVSTDEAGTVPPKKARGRPKKDPTTTTPPKRKRKTKAALSKALVSDADDEIYDSNPPTPSSRKQRSPPKSPGQLQLSQPIDTSTTSNIKNKGKDRAHLFSQITKAVTTYPPTHDPKNLTWHEKMLMYDPIVLEDLTIWLNTEGLDRVDEDDEVSPALVKEWCEENSICCLWRENLRGGARGRW